MTEKFLRNAEVHADQDFAKKTYFVKDDRIRVVFHLGDGKIIASIREYKKPTPDQKGQNLELHQNFVVDPYAKPMKQQHMYAELTELSKSEQVFLQAIKNYERELYEILQLRLVEEQELSLAISIYDTLRNDSNLPDIEKGSRENVRKDEDRQNVTAIDYLSPFLVNYVMSTTDRRTIPNHLPKKIAQQSRKLALKHSAKD